MQCWRSLTWHSSAIACELTWHSSISVQSSPVPLNPVRHVQVVLDKTESRAQSALGCEDKRQNKAVKSSAGEQHKNTGQGPT
eukprot:3068304-Rhodomonas_salina.2